MKLGIDATELHPGAVGGVRTAVRLLLAALRQYAPDVEIHALAPEEVETPRGVRAVATGGPRRPFLWRRSRQLRRHLRGLDLFHSPVTAFPDTPVPVTATVHELPFVENFRLEGQGRALVQEYWLARAMTRCRAIVAPTQATLRQLAIAHPAAPRITTVVPHPAPPVERTSHGHDGSLLYVGRLDKRKCVEALLEGASGAVPGEIRLAGPQAARRRRAIEDVAERLGLLGRVRFLGVVDANMLDDLYCRAAVVGLLSASEGFGFPVLEALARAVPVVVAKGTGAAEVGGGAAIAVDPLDREEVAKALREAASPAHRERIAVEGPSRAMEFTAERTARGYLEVFQRALGG
ncbi:MAG TPA: glycosyltransferase [Planctomycetota bacterium]|nr:glycosyltransferase [Planctomycetota bacterium]